MKTQNKIILAAVFFLLSFSLLSYAQSCSVTDVSASSSTTRATTGTSATVTSSYTGSSCTSETLYLLSSGDAGSLTVSDPSSGYYSGVASGTSKTFTITASTAGTYQYWSTVSSSESTKSSIVFVAPSVITVSGTPSSSTISTSTSVKVNVTLSNPGAAVDTSYRLVPDSGLQVSGDPVNTVTSLSMGAGSSATLQWTVSASSCFSGSKSVTLELGSDTNAFSTSMGVPCSSGSTNTEGTGAAAGTAAGATAGGAPAGGTQTKFTVVETDDGKQVSYSRTLDTDRQSKVSTVNLVIKNEMSNALENFEFKERIPESVAADPSELAFSLTPTRFEEGSIIAVWKIDKLLPGESISISYTVNKVVSSLKEFSASVISTAPITAGGRPVSTATSLKISGPGKVNVGDKITLTVLDQAGGYAVDALVLVTTPLNKVLKIYVNEKGEIQFTANDPGTYKFSSEIPIEGLLSTLSEAKPAVQLPFLGAGPGQPATPEAQAQQKTFLATLLAVVFSGTGLLAILILVILIFYYYNKKKKRKGL